METLGGLAVIALFIALIIAVIVAVSPSDCHTFTVRPVDGAYGVFAETNNKNARITHKLNLVEAAEICGNLNKVVGDKFARRESDEIPWTVD